MKPYLIQSLKSYSSDLAMSYLVYYPVRKDIYNKIVPRQPTLIQLHNALWVQLTER